jgi:O-antigen/teichoic acid export membrane protein
MSNVRRMAKNTTVLFVSQLLTYVIGFFVTIYSARYLGVEGYGILSYALALGGILIVFTELGLSTLSVREISRNKNLAQKYTSNILVIKTALSLITILVTFVIVNLMNYPQSTAYIIYIIMGSYVVNAFTSIFSSLSQAYEKMEYLSLGSILNSVIMLIGVLLVTQYQLGIVIFASIYLLDNLICLIYWIIISAWKFVLPKLEFDWNFSKITMKESIPFAITGIFALIAFRIDTVMLSLLSGDVAVGFYTAAYKLMEVMIFIPTVYVTSIYPIFSRFHISSRDILKFSFEKSFQYMIILSLPIAVGTSLLADQIILLIYQSGFSSSIIALQIVIWAIPLIFFNNVLATSMASINKQRDAMKIVFFAMIFNIIMNLILIPLYGFIAAACVTVLTELFTFTFYARNMSRYSFKIHLSRILPKPIIASLTMGIFIILVNLNLFLEIFISIIIYFGVLLLLKTFKDEDFDLIRQLKNKE